MQSIDYESIEGLVEKIDHNRSSIQVIFCCPRSGQNVRSQATIDSDSSSTSAVRSGVVTVAYFIIRRFIFNLIGLRGLGARYGAARLTSKATRKTRNKLRTSSSAQKKAIVQAFRNVKDQFVWDESTRQWTHRDTQQ